jgi:hypothetical protein
VKFAFIYLKVGIEEPLKIYPGAGKASPCKTTDTGEDGPSIGVTGVKWRSSEVTVVERERPPLSEELEPDRRRHRLVGDQRTRLSGSLRESLLDLPLVMDSV